ncbi:MAG TPA: hypothetical protein PLA87_09275 [Pseudomonadota bacterium]|nr:hypothetical protein [Pseudomonadota bacterium]
MTRQLYRVCSIGILDAVNNRHDDVFFGKLGPDSQVTHPRAMGN